MKSLDLFIRELLLIEENSHQLSTDQIKKLNLIRSKVSDIVKTVQTYPSALSINFPKPARLAESIVIKFSDHVLLNEKILKRGSKWVVTDKSGKKVLGTHASREKAVKQLQAIEISKAGR